MGRGTEHLVLSCEHASKKVPAAYRSLFAGAGNVLDTHRGSDIGTSDLGRYLARRLGTEVVMAKATRLLVDLNRSTHHRGIFSEYTRDLPAPERTAILARYYHPYRSAVDARVRDTLATTGIAVHVSVHSFTGIYEGRERQADIGLLYDPSRLPERRFCAAWQAMIRAREPALRVRRNYPYRGVADGLVTQLRGFHPADRYLAIELEVNQGWVGTGKWRALRALLAETLRHQLASTVLSGGPGQSPST